MKRSIFSAAILISMFFYAAFAAETTLGDLVIVDPNIRATAKKAPVSGGYLTVINLGDKPDRLLSASTEFAKKTEIHTMKMDGDVMKMRPLPDGIEIPAGGEIILKRGGNHLMFMRLQSQIMEGETYKVKLKFESAGEMEIDFQAVN